MWAYDFRSWSQASHFCAFRPRPIAALSTGWLCHITPSGSGTSPTIFLTTRFMSAPLRPVISALGTRVLLDMSPPVVPLSVGLRHGDTGPSVAV